jgi:hypothetical protein
LIFRILKSQDFQYPIVQHWIAELAPSAHVVNLTKLSPETDTDFSHASDMASNSSASLENPGPFSSCSIIAQTISIGERLWL